MKLLTFSGGAHPPDNKHWTSEKLVEDLLPMGDLVFPMGQHIGAPCKPIVEKGERVLVGQKIGEPQGPVSAAVYSSVSGTVKNIAELPTPPGMDVMSVVIENDGLYEEAEPLMSRSFENLAPDELRDIIKDAGIVGMGGACFPAHIKLTPPADRPIDHVIINGAECEPYLTSDYRMMLEEPDKIAEGARILLQIFPQAHLHMAIEDNKPEAIRKMTEAFKGIDRASVDVLKTKYPQGGEKQLIFAVAGREVPPGKLPADAGCVVTNTYTVYEIRNAVVTGRTSLSRIVTVSGDAVATPKNLRVRLGTCFREVIEAAGGFVTPPIKVLAGGPMMGMSINSLDVPVVKGTSGIIALSEKAAPLNEEYSCIRCGRCVEACPMGLLPFKLNALSLKSDYMGFKNNGGMNCIECGSCSFMCPSKRHLVQSCREAKRSVIAAMKRKG
ncbi:MAG: electron transport complex subunit RsxC [Aminobacterium colombiense]|nr:electron transport complex subunit RsxC [Aminobacterium colombiense]